MHKLRALGVLGFRELGLWGLRVLRLGSMDLRSHAV